MSSFVSRPIFISVSSGNTKLVGIPNINFPPGRFCGDVPCKAACYGNKAWRIYAEARAAWTRNAELATKDPAEFFNQLGAVLTYKAAERFRFCSQGDLPGQEFLNHAKRFCCSFPETRFLCFTKQHHLDFTGRPENFRIVASLWPGWGNPAELRRRKLPLAWMQDGTEERIPANAIACRGKCDACDLCWRLKPGQSVIFHKH